MHRLVTFVLCLAPLAVLPSCADDTYDGGIFVREAINPAAGCMVTAMIGETGLTHGYLPLEIPTSYVITAQMESRITALAGEEAQRTVILTSANVDLTFPNSKLFTAEELATMKSDSVTHFKSLFSAPLAPNASITDAGFSITTPALIEALQRKASTPNFAIEVLATFTVIGNMSGNTVTSQPFQYPISVVANSGLIEDAGVCPLPAGTVLKTGNSCGFLQDFAMTCCHTAAQLICPAIVDSKPSP